MPSYRFRVSWDEDDQIYRDILLKPNQSFDLFQTVILKAFEFKDKKPASFFESDDRWLKGREISSEVLVNKKGAAALSMLKTPVSALVNHPDKHFLFQYDPEKKWLFQIALIGLGKDLEENADYPMIVKSEGIAPVNVGAQGRFKEDISKTEDQFDLNREDMEEQGFGEDNSF